jgi:lysophospholipase L1-like esterase
MMPETKHDAARDDNLMERFDRHGLRRFRGRDAVLAIAVAALLLLLFEGGAVKTAGEQMNPGPGRSVMLAIGHPTSWIAENAHLAPLAHTATAWLSPNQSLGGGGFNTLTQSSGIPAVTPDAFDPTAIGQPAPPRRKLHTLLVTGDSMTIPLDSDLAQQLEPKGVHVIQDPHLGTGISNTFIVDWGKLAALQVRQDHPDAVVVFIGANDGFPMTGLGGKQISCCSAAWAAIYANRARQMANTYRQAGAAHVYWLTLPTPREQARHIIARTVNAAIEVAAQPWADQVRVIDTVPTFTPNDIYKDAININGTPTIVRQADGIHLNDAGSSLLAKIVLGVMARDYTY